MYKIEHDSLIRYNDKQVLFLCHTYKSFKSPILKYYCFLLWLSNLYFIKNDPFNKVAVIGGMFKILRTNPDPNRLSNHTSYTPKSSSVQISKNTPFHPCYLHKIILLTSSKYVLCTPSIPNPFLYPPPTPHTHPPTRTYPHKIPLKNQKQNFSMFSHKIWHIFHDSHTE